MGNFVRLVAVLTLLPLFPKIDANLPHKSSSRNLELVQLITLTRHGTTSPGLLFPNDPFADEWATMGPPETLTKAGIEGHCILGQFLRDRYGVFIAEKIREKASKIWSTDKERSIAAAYSTLAGILGEDCQAKNWIESFPRIDDIINSNSGIAKLAPIDPQGSFMHRTAWATCEKLSQLKETKVEPRRKSEFEKNRGFYQHISNLAAYNFTSFDQAKSVYESYLLAVQVKGHFSNWVTRESIEFLRKLYLKDYDLFFPSKQHTKLAAGPTLALIVRHVQKYSNPKLPTLGEKDLLMLFGHTTTMMAVTKALGIQLDDLPDFGASLLFEIFRGQSNKQTEFCAKLWYKTRPELEQLYLSGCGSFSCCPITKFVGILQKMSTHNYQRECQLH